MNPHIQNAHEVIDIELAAIQEIKTNLDDSFSESVDLIINRIPPGKLVVMGMGKSGHIGKKIAASFASTGTPSFFVHPAEAGHGDLGMISPRDVVLGISQSGRSDEFNTIISYLKRNGISLVSMTGSEDSPLALASNYILSTRIAKEACPLGLAPTASSTASVVLGDALAMCCMKARGFSTNDYALTHPHGALGRRLLLKISDVMITGEDLPILFKNMLIKDALLEITDKGFGFGVLVEAGKAIGIFTDGDLRRCLDSNIDIKVQKISEVVSKEFSYIHKEKLAVSAVELMEKAKISSLPVLDLDKNIEGVVNLRLLLQAGVI